MDFLITKCMLEVDLKERCHEEDLKMEDFVREHYQPAISGFNAYWAAQIKAL